MSRERALRLKEEYGYEIYSIKLLKNDPDLKSLK
jgi:hypothetical protein